jgi:hypothetical protein
MGVVVRVNVVSPVWNGTWTSLCDATPRWGLWFPTGAGGAGVIPATDVPRKPSFRGACGGGVSPGRPPPALSGPAVVRAARGRPATAFALAG